MKMWRLSRSVKNAIFLCLCALLIALVAFRGDTRDTFNYIEVFRGVDSIPWSPSKFQEEYFMEWGFGLLAGFVKEIGLSHEFLFLLVSGLTFLAIGKSSTAVGMQAWSTLPFYIPTFFLTQQFMQIRQGLAVALAFWAIALLAKGSRSWFVFLLIATAAMLFHMVSLVPVVAALGVMCSIPTSRSRVNWLWSLSLLVFVLSISRGITYTELFSFTERISTYVGDEEYGSARGLFDMANLRAILLTFIFLIFRPHETCSWFRAYMLFLGVYLVHLGIRLGFLDFAILSGRIGSALGFAEIFLWPLLLKGRIQSPLWAGFFALSYMVVHLVIALVFLVPFLIDDYFKPLY